MFRTLLLLLPLLKYSILQHANPSTDHWDYQRHGPDTWPRRFDTCEGDFQSPIDIRLSRVKYDPDLRPLSLHTYTTNTSLYVWNFTHNGHTITVHPPPLAHLIISGANLPETFYLVHFHFHWGYNVYQGSEHTLDGMKYPLEIHFVHQARYSRAFAVLSIIFDLHRDDNLHINDLLSILNQTTNTSISIEHQLNISRLFPTAGSSPHFYVYNGSLTTPPCTEGITWIILARHIPISAYQMEVFVRNSLPFNFRHPQKLHTRNVFANFQPNAHESLYDEDDANIHYSCAYMKQIPRVFLSSIAIIFFIRW